MTKPVRGLLLSLLILAGCDRGPDNSHLAEAESRQTRAAAASGRIDCALEGTGAFQRTCSLDEMAGEAGTILLVGRDDVGYRRLLVTTDGRGVVSADGAEPANVTIIDDGMIEVAVGADRYRLPATTRID